MELLYCVFQRSRDGTGNCEHPGSCMDGIQLQINSHFQLVQWPQVLEGEIRVVL